MSSNHDQVLAMLATKVVSEIFVWMLPRKLGEDEIRFDQKMFISIRWFLPPPSFEQLAWLIDVGDEILLSQTWDYMESDKAHYVHPVLQQQGCKMEMNLIYTISDIPSLLNAFPTP